MTEADTPPPEPPESGPSLRIPLIILAIVAAGAGAFLLFGKGCFDPAGAGDSPLTEKKLDRYREGDIFRTIVNTTVNGPVENKDWGFKGAGTFIYQGELDTVREVTGKEKKGGVVEVVMDLTIRRARDIQMAVELNDITLDLPPVIGNALISISDLFGPIPGSGMISAELLKKKWVRIGIIDAIDSALDKIGRPPLKDFFLLEPPTIQNFEGAGGRFVYRAGEGLVDVETRGDLSKEEERRVEDFSVFAESYILPAPDGSGPDKWDVDVRKIAHLLVPAPQMEATGSLTFSRGETKGDIVRLDIVEGLVEFSGASDTGETLGTWAASGFLDYNLKDNTVVKGELSGAVRIEKTSTDHILFELKWAAKPDYKVTIHGYRAASRADAEKDIVPVELK